MRFACSPASSPVSVSRPRAFRRSRLLIVGCGDVGTRVLRELKGRLRVRVLTSSPERVPALRQLGVVPLVGSLDRASELGRLAGLADRVLHLAPPPGGGRTDPRTAALLAALSRRTPPCAFVYGSTTGVYGDAGGARFDETRAVAPGSERAHRRVDAERRLRAWGRRTPGAAVSILRIPGIYAVGREGGDPRERVRRGAPVLAPEDDVYTNHIHADDLARACWLALWRARPQRVWHICDDTQRKMGDHFDRVADLSGLARPPRLPAAQLQAQVSPMQWSFLCESRRPGNARMKQELGLLLHHPDLSLSPSPLPCPL
jgi:nucleoside-diphosphate-sugar epimerase